MALSTLHILPAWGQPWIANLLVSATNMCRFEGLTSIKRHRLVYQILDAEMGNPIHALSLVTKTPKEAGMQ